MNLQTGDYIIIRGYDKDNFYSDKHFRKLLNRPTRVWDFGNRGVYIAHPDLDLIPLSDDVIYDKVIDSEDLPGHKEYKSKFGEFLKLTRNADLPNEKPFLKYLKKKKKNIKEEEENKESKLNSSLIKVIKKFEDNELESEYFDKMFGGLDKFISIISKRKLTHLINPFDPAYEEFQNYLFYAFYKSDKNFIWRIIDTYLTDINKIGGEYYYDTTPEELSQYFYEGRNDVSQETIQSILSFDYHQDFYSDITDDEYGDVYSELTPENKEIFNNQIIEELKDMRQLNVEYNSPDFIGELALEQGHEDYVEFTDEVISKLIQDEDSLEYLINQELDVVRGNLNSLYNMCYSDTQTDEWHEEIMDSLVGFVIDEPNGEEYEYKKSGWDKQGKRVSKTLYGKRYKVTDSVYGNVAKWVESNYKYNDTYDDRIVNLGGYYHLMKDMIEDGELEKIRLSLREYPDYRKIHRCMNDNLTSYI